MKAAVIQRYGSAQSFKIREMPEPSVGDSEVLVKVNVSSVNPVDCKIRQGKLKLVTGLDFPKILGADFAGEVIETASPESPYKKGDKVFGMARAAIGGAYAEYLKVKEKHIAPKPENLSMEEAAAMPLAGLTALQGLRDYGALMQGQQVLINGASGGVGTYAVQIAKAMGATVTGVCSTENLQIVNNLGALDVIDYTREEVLQEGNKYHLIFDTQGSLSFNKAKDFLFEGGCMVSTILSPQNLFGILLSKLVKHKEMKTFLLKPNHDDLMDLKRLVDEGKLTSVIDQTFSLEEMPEAHERSEGGHARGKIVIEVNS